MNKKYIILALAIMACINMVSAADTYVESLQKLNEQVATSEKNIRDDINSFNAAFKDTFTLVDNEISRLILANGAMVGVVFAIMFLVYAKTTSRTKRDLQVLLSAHAKHIDNMISNRLNEFELRMDNKLRARDTNTLSKLGGEFDSMVGSIVESDETMTRRRPEKETKTALEEPKVAENKPTEKKNGVERISAAIKTIEPAVDKDGKVKILKEQTPSSNRFLKRMKRGVRRLLGKDKPKEKIQEFKK